MKSRFKKILDKMQKAAELSSDLNNRDERRARQMSSIPASNDKQRWRYPDGPWKYDPTPVPGKFGCERGMIRRHINERYILTRCPRCAGIQLVGGIEVTGDNDRPTLSESITCSCERCRTEFIIKEGRMSVLDKGEDEELH